MFYNKVGFLFGKDMIYLDPFQFSRGCNYVRERIEFIVEVLNFPPERIILIGNQASSSVVLFGAISSKYKVKVLSFGAFFPQPFFPNYWRKIVDFSSLTKEQKDMEIILYRNSVYDGYVDPEIKKNFGISDSLKNPRDNYLIPPVLTDKLHQKLLDEGFTNVKLMSCDTNDGFDFELVKNNLHSSKFVQSFEDKDGMLGKKHDISKKVFFFLLGVAFIFPVILSLFFLSFFQLKKQKRKSLRIKSHL